MLWFLFFFSLCLFFLLIPNPLKNSQPNDILTDVSLWPERAARCQKKLPLLDAMAAPHIFLKNWSSPILSPGGISAGRHLFPMVMGNKNLWLTKRPREPPRGLPTKPETKTLNLSDIANPVIKNRYRPGSGLCHPLFRSASHGYGVSAIILR
jgi:hypothetical protein